MKNKIVMDEKFKKAYGIYDGIDTSIFKHIPEISFYNNNYYIGLRRENDVNNEFSDEGVLILRIRNLLKLISKVYNVLHLEFLGRMKG